MGAVYRAEDSRLGRTVAVKILLPEVNEDLERRSRFLREARAAAGLNHPNIAVIFEVGEARFDERTLIELGLHGRDSKPPSHGADQLPFFAMEYVPGDDLGTLMEAEGPMEIDRVADLARQIARALEAAHGAGIVHRDLKPANVRVTPEGRVKLLDFGLAKLLSREKGRTVDSGTGSQLTLDGMVMGTLPYLAPEQLQGLKVDGRADLFALGVMLYEMLAGNPPFPSTSMVEYARALLIGDVPSPSTLREEAPDWLDDLVMKLLHTDPARRPMSAAVVRMALEEHMTSFRDASGTTVTVLKKVEPEPQTGPLSPHRLPAAAMTVAFVLLVVIAGLAVAWFYGSDGVEPRVLVPGPPAVAVLPLVATGEPPPLALGLVAYINQRFELLPGVAVRDLEDTLRYQRVAAGVGALGQEFHADWVLSGEILDAEPLRARLVWVRSVDGRVLWSEDVDLSGDGILAVQDELFERILQGNDRLLTVGEPQPATRSRTALRSYLLALARLNGPRPETAAAAFERSLDEDPLFFWALVHGAQCIRVGLCVGTGDEAEDQLQRALELQPDHPVALLEQARRDLAAGRSDVALANAERLLAQNPTYVPALVFHAGQLTRLGKVSDARSVLERALRQDPGAWRLYDRLGLLLRDQGYLAAAAHQLAEADRLAPDRVTLARAHRFQALQRMGRAQEIVDLQTAEPLRVDRPELAQVLGWAHETLANPELARGMFGLAVELDPDDPLPWYELGRFYERAQRDDFARASFNEARKIWQKRLDAVESPAASGGAAADVARGWYGFLEAKRGRCDKALETLERGQRLEDGQTLEAGQTIRPASAEEARLVARLLRLCERPDEADAVLATAAELGRSDDAQAAFPGSGV